MFTKFTGLIENKNLVLGFLMTVAAGAAVFGYNFDPAKVIAVLTPLMVGLGIHGWTTNTQIVANNALKMHTITALTTTHDVAVIREIHAAAGMPIAIPRAPTAQGITAALMIALVVFAPLMSGCGAAQKVETVATDGYDCIKEEAAALGKGVDLLQAAIDIAQVIATVVESTDPAQAIVSLGIRYGEPVAACVTKDLLAAHTTPIAATPGSAVHGEAVTDSVGVTAAKIIQSKGWKFKETK